MQNSGVCSLRLKKGKRSNKLIKKKLVSSLSVLIKQFKTVDLKKILSSDFVSNLLQVYLKSKFIFVYFQNGGHLKLLTSNILKTVKYNRDKISKVIENY